MPASPGPTARALTPEIEAELAEVAAAAGCELIHLDWKGGVLRLVLDRPPAPRPAAAARDLWEDATPGPPDGGAAADSSFGSSSSSGASGASGVSLGDCEQVARQASALLDVLDFGGGRYLLEVSSPGLDRQLYRPSDYPRFLGRLARVTYETPGPAAKPARRTVVARLAEFRRPAISAGAGPGTDGDDDDEAGEVTLIDDRTGERLTVPLAAIRVARLEVEP
jgi:ribosome maturation factor RimP